LKREGKFEGLISGNLRAGGGGDKRRGGPRLGRRQSI